MYERFIFLKIIAFVLSALVLTACSNDSELHWTEEVKLADGRIIIVKRYSEFKAPREIGQPSGESYTRLEFEHPVTKETVQFESKLFATTKEMEAARANPVRNPGIKHRPYALMMKSEWLYLVTWLDASIDNFFGCPDPPFFLYLWKGGRWENRPIEEIPRRKFIPNLTIDPLSAKSTIRSNGYHLAPEQTVFIDRGHGPIEYDFSGMSKQTFDLPPNCTSCTQRGPYGPRADSPITPPTCLREQREWLSRKHLSN